MLRNSFSDLTGQDPQPRLGVLDLTDQVAAQLFARSFRWSDRADADEHCSGRVQGQLGVSTARHEIPQQGVELVDQPGSVGRHVVAALVEERAPRRDLLPPLDSRRQRALRH